jgi:hypothetical protein
MSSQRYESRERSRAINQSRVGPTLADEPHSPAPVSLSAERSVIGRGSEPQRSDNEVRNVTIGSSSAGRAELGKVAVPALKEWWMRRGRQTCW